MTHSHFKQNGVALVVALILLVVMTLVGLSAIRLVTQEEKMAGYTLDRSFSFQAAESALRQAEALVDTTTPTPTACSNGICPDNPPANTPRWLDSTFTGWQSATAVSNGAITLTPQYLIEYLGNTYPCDPNATTTVNECRRYRITARSNAGDGRADVMLQSTYGTN